MHPISRMDRRAPDYIIDPEGEVIIILRNADSPFAQPLEDTVTGMALPKPSHRTQSPAEVIESPQTNSETSRNKRRNKGLSASPTSPKPASTEGPQIDEQLENNCFYIQVSAKHLMFSSSVFKSMLSGGWKESVEFQQKGSIELTADSWGIEDFMIVLRAMHGKFYLIPRKLTLEMLAKVAVIVDYYDCKEALDILKDTWINNLEEKISTTYSRNLILWLWISWFFQLRLQFKETTSTVMSRSENQINGWGLPIPDKVIGLMNTSREGAINNLLLRLHASREALLGGSRGCGFECRAILYGALTMQMQSSQLLSPKPAAPFPRLDYKVLRSKILSFKSPKWSNCNQARDPGGYYNTNTARHTCPDSSFATLFANFNECIEGLDLNGLD
ncbi:unnamed protein product [Penicillium nalgiovense]|nr:unnamed protein product [Penicillium nalgiovense]